MFLFNFFLTKVILSLFFSFLVSFFFIKYFLFFCNKYKIYGTLRKNNIKKKNIKIPIMGGIIILINFLFISFIFVNLLDINILMLVLFFVFNFFIGLLDDLLKIYFQNSDGLSILQKFFLQNLFIFFYIYFLFFKNIYINDEKIFFLNIFFKKYFYCIV